MISITPSLSLLYPPAFIGNIGPVELGVVFVIVLIVFGPGKLPDVFKALGSGVKQFKDASAGITESTSTNQQSALTTTHSETTTDPTHSESKVTSEV